MNWGKLKDQVSGLEEKIDLNTRTALPSTDGHRISNENTTITHDGEDQD